CLASSQSHFPIVRQLRTNRRNLPGQSQTHCLQGAFPGRRGDKRPLFPPESFPAPQPRRSISPAGLLQRPFPERDSQLCPASPAEFRDAESPPTPYCPPQKRPHDSAARSNDRHQPMSFQILDSISPQAPASAERRRLGPEQQSTSKSDPLQI